ncbi:MAG TPA: hypothetical protein VHB78_00510 [Vicinamibacterales bacterium]|jgi:hypothetical protein|nr:hypothetical protein [Vicinamibacterales bacterium]
MRTSNVNVGRVFRPGVIVALALVVLLSSSVDRAQQGDQINTSGGNEVSDARAWWANPTAHTDEFRTQTRGCLHFLDDAETHRQASARYREQAKAPGLRGPERSRLQKLANDEYTIVNRLVRQFYDCARPTSDRIETGPRSYGTPTPSSRGRGDAINTNGGNTKPQQPARGTTQRTPTPTLSGQADVTERVCNLQTLAVWLFRNYSTDQPIMRVRLANASRPTYLILLSGVSWNPATANTLGQAYVAWANVQAMDAYRLAVMDAVANLPKGTDVILAGHSQGGMEAQDIVEGLQNQYGLNVKQVISYGAPVTESSWPGTSYLHVRAPDDPILNIQRRILLSARQYVRSNAGTADPHRSYASPESGLSLFRVPTVSTLKTPCFEIDLRTIERFGAPNLVDRFREIYGPLDPRQVHRAPLNPHQPIDPDTPKYNCFWVALAKDREWASGIPVPARCENGTADNDVVESVLWRRYGGRTLDDGHGPSAADGIARHADGYPVPFSSQRKIEHALATPGSRGLVFVYDKRNPNGAGHIVNARNLGGRFEYYDEQSGHDASFWFHDPNAGFKFYRTN